MAAYRSIRPSQHSSDSASGSGSRSTGPDPGAGGSGESSGGSGGGKKRRAPQFVTPNACTNCKKARAKCNGEKPACSRCTTRDQGETCTYELHVKTAKEQMVREIRDLKEKNSWIEKILEALVSNGQGKNIARRLRSGESYRAIANSMGPSSMEIPHLSPTSEHRLSEALMDYEMDGGEEKYAESVLINERHWTGVTPNEALVDHLVALYFTWVHPVHMIFSENHFMVSYDSKSDLYCSSVLVNAICAMGCHVYDPEGDEGNKMETDPQILGEKFMNEARSLIRPGESLPMCTVQAYAIMFMVDLASGRASRASTYIRIAAENLNNRLEAQYSTEALEISKWGIYALNVVWSADTYQIPVFLNMQNSDVFSNVRIDMHDSVWRNYRHTGDFSIPERASSAMHTAAEYAKLSRLIHQTVNSFYDSHGQELTAEGVLGQYKNYLDWRDSLPPEVAITSPESEALPHVLVLHVQYHAALVSLFRPLLSLSILSKRTRQHLQDVILINAHYGVALLKIYRKSYSCRYLPPLQSFALLHVCDAVVRYGQAPKNVETVQFCLEVLKEAANGRGGFAICGPLQEAFRQTAIECKVALPDNIGELMGSANYGADDILDACARLTYAQPVDQVIQKVSSTIEEDFSEEWRKVIEHHKPEETRANTDTGRYMQIDSLLNEGSAE